MAIKRRSRQEILVSITTGAAVLTIGFLAFQVLAFEFYGFQGLLLLGAFAALAGVAGWLRYRSIAKVVSIVVAVLVFGVLVRNFAPENLGLKVASLKGATTVPVLAEAEFDGLHVAVNELVWDGGTGYVRFVVWDTGTHAEVLIEPVAITTSTGRRIDLEPHSTILSVTNVVMPNGDRIDRRTDAGWVKFTDPDHDPLGSLSFEVRLEEQPLEVVIEGGILFEPSEPFPILTVEHEGTGL